MLLAVSTPNLAKWKQNSLNKSKCKGAKENIIMVPIYNTCSSNQRPCLSHAVMRASKILGGVK